MTQDKLLVCSDVNKTYKPRVETIRVLNSVSLQVLQGEICIITGKSGAGKSTLLSILAGIERQDSGAVSFDGQDYASLSRAAQTRLRGEHMGFVFQSFHLIPTWNAFENVEASILHTQLSSQQRADKVNAILDRLGLADRKDNLPVELSVGQQQRVAIARAIVHRPKLIFADQPTGDLDDATASEIVDLLVEYVKEANATLVVAAHGHFPLHIADSVYVLENGQLSATENGV